MIIRKRSFPWRVVAIFVAICILATSIGFAAFADVSQRTREWRFSGSDRYETANHIARSGWERGSNTVILASGKNYPDALAGAPFAYALDAPILLVDGDSIRDSVLNQIQSLGATSVYILGGASAVSPKIESFLKDKNYTVERIWGSSRYDTADEIAKRLRTLKGTPSEAFIISGENYPDALAVGPIAALKGVPVLYANRSGQIINNTKQFISDCHISNAYIVGGTAAVSDNVRGALSSCGVSGIMRYFGSNRYMTALEVNNAFESVFPDRDLVFATGENYPDALAGGVYAAKKGVPLLLTNAKFEAASASGSGATKVNATARINGFSRLLSAASSLPLSVSSEEWEAADPGASAYSGFINALVKYVQARNPENVYLCGGESVLPSHVINSYIYPPRQATTTTAKKTATLYGRVIDYEYYDIEESEMTSVAGAVVQVYSGSELVGRAVTTEQGVFEIPNLPIAKYQVNISARDYAPLSKMIDLANPSVVLNLSIGEVGGEIFFMEHSRASYGILSGTVECSVNEDARVYYSGSEASGYCNVIDGVYSVDLPTGNYTVYAALLDGSYVYHKTSNKNAVISANRTTYVNFIMDDDSPQPDLVANITVYAHFGKTNQIPWSGARVIIQKGSTVYATGTTNNSGRYSLANLPYGDYMITVTHTYQGRNYTNGPWGFSIDRRGTFSMDLTYDFNTGASIS